MSLIWENGKVRELTPEEIVEMNAQAEQAEREYWLNISYDEAVNAEIRKKYSESQEFAILRQANTKPEEYEIYYNYCEECKAYVKAKQKEVLE
jgi:head-tail adaptor